MTSSDSEKLLILNALSSLNPFPKANTNQVEKIAFLKEGRNVDIQPAAKLFAIFLWIIR